MTSSTNDGTVGPCPDDNTLTRYLEGSLSPTRMESVRGHVARCLACAREAGLALATGTESTPPLSPASEQNADDGDPGWPDFGEEYQLVRPLGRGAFGVVYLARDLLLDRLVAIKCLLKIGAAEPDHERFLAEVRAVARLSHPNMMRMYRAGRAGQCWFFVSEFLDGQLLSSREGTWPWQRVLRLGLGLASGLAAAHRERILHRDIKPSNIMVMPGDEPKLLDFGLAKLLDTFSRSDRLPERLIIGTPRYMAPEAYRGSASYRSDVYSLGLVLYELCSGALPGDGPQGPYHPVPLAARVTDIEPTFAALIDRCVARDVAARPTDGEALEEELEVLSGAPPYPRRAPGIENPYSGLAAFDAARRAFFFGRRSDSRAVLNRLRTEPMVLIAGDSGIGKSSFCMAGVLPAIAEGGLDPRRSFACVRLVPGSRPIRALAVATAGLLRMQEEVAEAWLRAYPEALGRELRRGQSTDAGVVLFLDQLEELVTLSVAEDAALLGRILGDLAVPALGVRVLLTARADFLARLSALPGLGRELQRSLYFLPPLSAGGLREAVVSPARQLGVSFESPALVDSLVKATVDTPGSLPLLQFTLAELWETRERGSSVLTGAALATIGGLSGALARHADGVLRGLLPSQHRAARHVLTALVTQEGTRARLCETELGPIDDLEQTLMLLVQGRLLTTSQSPEGATYELAHEALIYGWCTLRGWLGGEAEARLLRRRIAAAAQEWERLAHSAEALWSKRQLEEAARLKEDELPRRDRLFLTASRRSVHQQRIRRLALLMAAPALVLATYGLALINTTKHRARAVTEHIAAAAQAQTEGRHDDESSQARQAAAEAVFAKGTMSWEADWAQALVLGKHAEAAYVRADQELAAALALAPERRDVQQQYSEVIVARLTLAERLGHDERRMELRLRLGNIDRDALVHWDRPVPLSVDTQPRGAQVVVRRYAERDGHRVLDAVVALGVSPARTWLLPQGSYLIEAAYPSRPTARLPVRLSRDARVAVAVPLPARVPEGFVYVPPGDFLFGSAHEDLRVFLGTQPLHRVSTAGYFIGRYEVTFADWLAYLDALGPQERRQRLPHALNIDGDEGVMLQRASGRDWTLTLRPQAATYQAAAGAPLRYQGRVTGAVQDWLRMPVVGISAEDAEAYVGWLGLSGRVPGARLCSEHEWERAARGADERVYPHGDRLAAVEANFDETYGRVRNAFGPDAVGAHPAAASPFGVDDLVGNVEEWTHSKLSGETYVLRSSSWYQDRTMGYVNNRQPATATTRSLLIGLRVCADPRSEIDGMDKSGDKG